MRVLALHEDLMGLFYERGSIKDRNKRIGRLYGLAEILY